MIATQLRATGGILFRLEKTNILIDPGPESLYRLLNYVPKFNPEKLDAVVLSHKHIDHSADINVDIDQDIAQTVLVNMESRKGHFAC